MEVESSCRSNFYLCYKRALYIPLLHALHPDATGDAERRSYRCENADGNLKDGFPSFFLHNRKFLNG